MRKLKFKEIGMFTKILKNLEIKSYKKELLENINVDYIDQIKNEKERKTAMENAKKSIAVDVVIHIIEKYDEAEQDIFVFFASYKDIKVDEVKEKDIDWVIDTAKELYNHGLPKFLKDLIKLDDIENEIKKKMENRENS